MKSLGLSWEDAQVRDQWRMTIRQQPANPGLCTKIAINTVHACN